jgi:hypothetical protein
VFITITLIVCVAAALVGGLALRVSLAGYEPVRSQSFGPFSVELRRRALVRGHPNGKGGHAFAQPSETRLRVIRCAGFPLWRQSRSVELPLQVVDMMGTLTARDFDAEFDARFRLASFAMLVPAWAARLRMRGNGGPGNVH